jgi:hypothetical protein
VVAIRTLSRDLSEIECPGVSKLCWAQAIMNGIPSWAEARDASADRLFTSSS